MVSCENTASAAATEMVAALSRVRKNNYIDADNPNAYILPYYAGTMNEKQKNQRRDALLKKVNAGLRTICKEIGIAPFTTYNLRHTYAIYARDIGKLDEGQIQQILGHKSITTTQHYLNGITAPLMEAHNGYITKMMEGGAL